ncbi:MAG: GDP-mannose 4,6-dehydratase [Desulfobacterota bacterium]|nr:GDP-mannose 4,6-dehydratase [Thermodesulfobacteriota bacterium]
MKILITGGCGFIGSHVVDFYIELGHDVAIVDNLSTGKIENKNPKARFYHVDITDDALKDVFEAENPDVVNHHAAQISVPYSVENPLFDAKVNIEGTIRLLELSRKYRIKKFIFASTGGAIYGETSVVPTDEDLTPDPRSPYAVSKLACERYILFYYYHYGLNFTILRYSNVYGPRQIPHGEAGVVAIFIEKLLRKERPVLYHYPEDEDGMVRDYVYVKDVAKANVLATFSGKNGIYNISTGTGTKTIKLYNQILEALTERGLEISKELKEPIRAFARPGDLKVSVLSPKKAKEELSWHPEHDLPLGLRKTLTWYLDGKD